MVSSLGRRGTCFISLGLGSWQVTFFPKMARCVHLRPGNVTSGNSSCLWQQQVGDSPGGLQEGHPYRESWEASAGGGAPCAHGEHLLARGQKQRRCRTDGCGACALPRRRGEVTMLFTLARVCLRTHQNDTQETNKSGSPRRAGGAAKGTGRAGGETRTPPAASGMLFPFDTEQSTRRLPAAPRPFPSTSRLVPAAPMSGRS